MTFATFYTHRKNPRDCIHIFRLTSRRLADNVGRVDDDSRCPWRNELDPYERIVMLQCCALVHLPNAAQITWAISIAAAARGRVPRSRTRLWILRSQRIWNRPHFSRNPCPRSRSYSNLRYYLVLRVVDEIRTTYNDRGCRSHHRYPTGNPSSCLAKHIEDSQP